MKKDDLTIDTLMLLQVLLIVLRILLYLLVLLECVLIFALLIGSSFTLERLAISLQINVFMILGYNEIDDFLKDQILGFNKKGQEIFDKMRKEHAN